MHNWTYYSCSHDIRVKILYGLHLPDFNTSTLQGVTCLPRRQCLNIHTNSHVHTNKCMQAQGNGHAIFLSLSLYTLFMFLSLATSLPHSLIFHSLSVLCIHEKPYFHMWLIILSLILHISSQTFNWKPRHQLLIPPSLDDCYNLFTNHIPPFLDIVVTHFHQPYTSK